MHSRPLGYFETILYFGHIRGVTQMTLSFQIKGALNETMFRRAFFSLYLKHPLLRSTVHWQNESLYFELANNFSNIPIEFYIEDSGRIYERVFLEQTQQQLPLDQRNWSVAVVQSASKNGEKCFDIIWHISHVIADGLSFFNLVQELVSYLDDQIENKILSVKSLPLYDKLETYLPKKISLHDFFSHQESACSGVNNLQLLPLTESNRSEKSYFVREINSNDLENLQKKFFSESVTLNNMINASLLHAYCKIQDETQTLCINSAINLRNKCKPKIPVTICGNYFSTLSVMLTKDDLNLSRLKLAKCYKNKLGSAIRKGIFVPTDYNDHEMQEKVKKFMLPCKDERREVLNTSYIGEIKIKSRHLQIESFMIHPKHADGNNLITFIFNKKMYLLFCFAPEYRTKMWASELADQVIKNLLDTM